MSRLRTAGRRFWTVWSWIAGMLLLGAVALGGLFAWDYYGRDEPQAFFGRDVPDDPVMQFKYGSTGGDRLVGMPVGLFKALPLLCRDYLQGEGWESLGFVYEPGMDRPIGTSLRRSLGFDRIGLNCATCHVGTWRGRPEDEPNVVVGMPSNRVDLGRFARFLTQCALDERFNPWQVVQAAETATGERYGLLDRLMLQYLAVPAMKEFIVLARHRFRFLDHEPEPGPGRFDTFGPAKALLNWPLDRLPPRERIGIVDFPSLWLQGPREGMQLHWDGNNTSVDERNRSAAFGSGAVPTTIDREALGFTAVWLRSDENAPPPWPFAIDRALAARGAPLYERHCAACHGATGRDFSGPLVGRVDPIEKIRTDPCRLDNYTEALAAEQNNLYAGFPEERFRHFRKTYGYANQPLDGIWLRGPYLHNGSVPTVRDLLEPAELRPAVFYRGNDVIDARKLGFVSDVPEADAGSGQRSFFRYETRCTGDAAACAGALNPQNRHDDNLCVPGPWAGNSNRGHDGPEYGTHLPAADKDAIVEFMKTF